MGYNNKHILEGVSEGKKLVGGLVSYVDDEIKNDNHKNMMLSR